MPTTLLDWLLTRFPSAKRQTLKRMLMSGRVRVNGLRPSRLKQLINGGDRVEVLDRAAPRQKHLIDALSGIIYEDEDLLVVDKPAGLLTSTVPRERRPTLLGRVRRYVARQDPAAQVGLIHRLDQDASGLLVFSKNDEAYRSLKSQFFHHTVNREYRAVVHGIPSPPTGRIETRLVERADGTVYSARQSGKGNRAVTEYELIRTEENLSLLRVKLHTGRKHQIRVHLRDRGTPIVGDRVYGPQHPASRLMLAATRLTIRHPRTGNEMTFSAPLPAAFPVRDAPPESPFPSLQ